jgi:cytochrome c553
MIGRFHIGAIVFLSAGASAFAEPKIDFNRDIRPIFSDNCYQCHGPDKNKRKGDLRLDTKEGVASTLAAGKPEESELIRRLTTPDKDERMPAPKSGKSLSAPQIALIKKWIEQGAEWKGHWAYIKPARVEPPRVTDVGRVKNPIDRFVLARLEQERLGASPEADRVTLIRRLYFDLLGLPPTQDQVKTSLSDESPEWYEKRVDELLASPHYGERVALYWLDLVRYADSIGYHSDNPMNVWPYRDYVIKAFNDNKRFDQFTIEQLAGDLLPNASREQQVASAYNRLLQTTEEGGAQAKEYEAKYAADRVRNVASVWMALTLGCCQCHDHKFDPYSTKDFYSLAAFFADVQEAAVGRREAGLPLPTPEQAAALQKLDEQMSPLQKTLANQTPDLDKSQAKWEETLLLRDARKLPKNVLDVVLLEPGKRSEPQKKELAAHFRTLAPELKSARDQFAALQKQKDELNKAIPTCLVSRSGTPRSVRILPRGNWLDESGPVMSPATPASLSVNSATAKAGAGAKRASRLDLAQWIVARDNPLTARVFVNRLWQLFFGQGLVKSLEDFGSQGEWPAHPELLDWLATEFMASGWNVKHVVKLIVMSGTYRQSSQPTAEQKERDPYNRLLARQARFRLDAEFVRDSALSISELLSPHVGGPSVKPYQPAGYWAALNFPTREWQNDTGEKLYRRSLYTHWQRTFLHPSLLAFDAPSREECCVERPRSNIPQQALVLLNDPIYVEAARGFAERILKEGGKDDAGRLKWACLVGLSREPKAEEAKVLGELLAKHRKEFAADKEGAQKLLGIGAHPTGNQTDAAELAAWMSVARVILNLHEAVTRN